MDETKSLSHTKWECKYHVVVVPKYWKRVFYGRLRKQIGGILKDLMRCTKLDYQPLIHYRDAVGECPVSLCRRSGRGLCSQTRNHSGRAHRSR